MVDQTVEQFLYEDTSAGLSNVSDSPSFMKTMGAAFEDANIVGAAISSRTIREGLFPTDRTPISDSDLSTRLASDGLNNWADRFLDVQTVGQYEALKSDIQRELENDQILADAGAMGMGAQMIAGIFDLPTIMPLGHALKLGKAGVTSLKGTASRLAISSAIDATATEAALHSIQQTRTLEESVYGVGASVVLTSVIGTGIAKAISTERFGNLTNKMGATLAELEANAVARRLNQVGEEVEGRMNGTHSGPDVNAPMVRNPYAGPKLDTEIDIDDPITATARAKEDPTAARMSPSQMAFANTLGVEGFARRSSRLFGGNVMLDSMNAKANSVRELMANLAELPVYLKGNLENVASPISALSGRARLEGQHAQSVKDFMTAYRGWRKGLDLSGKDLATFSRLVTKANANSDIDADPNIAAGAKAVRGFYKEIAEANIRAGLLRRMNADDEIAARGEVGPHVEQFQSIDGPDAAAPAGPAKPAPKGPAGPGLPNTGGAGPGQARLGVRESVKARKDSPEFLDVDQFHKSASRGTIASVSRKKPVKREGVQPRTEGEELPDFRFVPGMSSPEIGKGGSRAQFENLNLIDELLNSGVRRGDIARTIAHKWAYENDPKYKEASDAWTKQSYIHAVASAKKKGVVSEAVLAKLKELRPGDFNEIVEAAMKLPRDAKPPKLPPLRSVHIRSAYEFLQAEKVKFQETVPEPDTPGPRADSDLGDEMSLRRNGPPHLPPVRKGYVRFYHGGSDTIGPGEKRWVTPDYVYARDYREGSTVFYVDIPENHPSLVKAFDDEGTSTSAPYVAFEADPWLTSRLRNVGKPSAGQLATVGGGKSPPGDVLPPRFRSHERAADIDPESYVKRMFRRDKILHEEAEFVRLEAKAYVMQWRNETGKTLADLPKKAREALVNSARRHAQGVYTAIVHDHNLVGQTHSGNMKNAGNRRGSVLERNTFMSTRDLLAKGWIEDDALLLMGRALRTNGTDAILAMRFRRAPNEAEIRAAASNSREAYWLDGEDPTSVPDLDLTVPKETIAREYDDLIFAAKTDEERLALANERNKMLDHAQTAMDLMRGTYLDASVGDRAQRNLAAVRDWQFGTKMGNILLSSIPDIGLQVMQHGPGRVANYAAKRAATRIRELFDGADEKSVELIRRDARIASVAIETESMTRMTSMADIHDPLSSSGAEMSPAHRFARNMSFFASRAFGAVYWNNAMGRIGYGIFQDRVTRAALDPGNITDAERRFLRWVGANDGFLRDLRGQLVKHGQDRADGGLYFADTSRWDDIRVQEQFYAMARKVQRSSVITPHALEKPMALNNPWGSSILQFSSYVFGATMRVSAMAAARVHAGGAASKEAAGVYMGMATMMGLAATSVALKFAAAGKLEDMPDPTENVGWWTYEMLDRSGLLGLFTHFNNLGEAGGFPGLRRMSQRAFGDERVFTGSTEKSRPRPAPYLALGPLAMPMDDLATVSRDLLWAPFSDEQEITGRTVKAASRLTPIVGSVFLRRLTEEGQKYITEEILGDTYK